MLFLCLFRIIVHYCFCSIAFTFTDTSWTQGAVAVPSIDTTALNPKCVIFSVLDLITAEIVTDDNLDQRNKTIRVLALGQPVFSECCCMLI